MLTLLVGLCVAVPGDNYHADLYKLPEIPAALTFDNTTLQLASDFAWAYPWMVLSHELGHFEAATQKGFGARVEIVGWGQGLTYYYPPKKVSNADWATVTAAGVNQQKYNAIAIFNQWAVTGDTNYTRSLLYLVAKTNLTLYAFRSSITTSYTDDLGWFVKYSRTKITPQEIFALSVISDVLSVPLWVALWGVANFLFTGEKTVDALYLTIGPVSIAWPDINLILKPRSPEVNVSTVLVINKVATEINIGVRNDGFTVKGTIYY